MLTKAHVHAVLMRGAINQLRFARLCVRRSCRRANACRDRRDGEPRCTAAWDAIDQGALTELYNLVVRILWETYPARPADDAAQRAREDDAIEVIIACLDPLPDLGLLFFDWHDRYKAPPVAPAPPVDTRALLAEMKTTLARDKRLSGLRG